MVYLTSIVAAKYVATQLITMSTINVPSRLLSEVHRRTAAAPPTPAEAAEAMTGSAISVVAQPCLRVNPRHVNRDIAAMPSRGVGRAASQRRAFARDTIPLWVYASGSPIIHRRNRRSVRRLTWPSTPSLLATAQPQPLSCCHRFGQASIQASAS